MTTGVRVVNKNLVERTTKLRIGMKNYYLAIKIIAAKKWII